MVFGRIRGSVRYFKSNILLSYRIVWRAPVRYHCAMSLWYFLRVPASRRASCNWALSCLGSGIGVEDDNVIVTCSSCMLSTSTFLGSVAQSFYHKLALTQFKRRKEIGLFCSILLPFRFFRVKIIIIYLVLVDN